MCFICNFKTSAAHDLTDVTAPQAAPHPGIWQARRAFILAAGAVPTPRPSKWVEKAAQVSFSMFISNEVVRIAWFGVVNVMIAKFALPVAAQWALWGMGVMAAFVFAFLFYVLIDTPIQDRIRARLKGRSRLQERLAAVVRPAVPLKG